MSKNFHTTLDYFKQNFINKNEPKMLPVYISSIIILTFIFAQQKVLFKSLIKEKP
jgi:hypothetical protein